MAKYKIGDKLRCKPGFTSDGNGDYDLNHGGNGYKKDAVFTVERITNGVSCDGRPNNDTVVYWADKNYHSTNGIFQRAVELAEEVINNYQIY